MNLKTFIFRNRINVLIVFSFLWIQSTPVFGQRIIEPSLEYNQLDSLDRKTGLWREFDLYEGGCMNYVAHKTLIYEEDSLICSLDIFDDQNACYAHDEGLLYTFVYPKKNLKVLILLDEYQPDMDEDNWKDFNIALMSYANVEELSIWQNHSFLKSKVGIKYYGQTLYGKYSIYENETLISEYYID